MRSTAGVVDDRLLVYLRGLLMEKSRHLWVLALVFGVVGCAGEDSGPPAAGTAGAGGSAKPTVNKVDTSSGQAPAAGAPATSPTGGHAASAPSKEEPKKTDAPALEGPKAEAAHENGKAEKLTDEEIATIKKLPAADAELAIRQVSCPVSGDHLGNMGAPFKVSAEGRTFFLCCKGCEDDVKANPKAVIAKLYKK